MSEYVGEVGQKLVLPLTVTGFHHLHRESYEVATLVIYQTATNDIVKWFCSTQIEPTVGDTHMLQVRVKEHKEYNQVRETYVSHVKPHLNVKEKAARLKARKAAQKKWAELDEVAQHIWENWVDYNQEDYVEARDAANQAWKEYEQLK